MNLLRSTFLAGLSVAVAACFCSDANALAIELTTNGGFETGDYTGWQNFGTSGSPTAPGIPGPSDQQTITSVNPSGGTFAGSIDNNLPFGNSLIKQANLAPGGQISPGQQIDIQFDARGTYAAPGGVAFAEFFTELAGGGTSSAGILGGAPLGINPDPNVWTTFNFTVFAGPDTSGGVTLQLGATTGPAGGTVMFYDNVSVSVDSLNNVVPEPTSAALIGLAGLGLAVRRRR
ncbi:PEP-CTERM sorting domain-containing protein [Botrimarina hoheduenensis]|uniref:Ice-binding protein C-terminal domain-containing protein n=1 Tax=Botrimarina hoheduenensis TaxID=2528000 RepID=A0A5C5W9E6_9BACT|nr:PEP-CTERM sorting domain-containing protein [Botrimarina hoheduenensis]TWT47498.1 hypothetical protein Pla111_11120 [Botrimarina hoheduenensis]